MDKIYSLQEFYTPKIVTGEINPDDVNPIKYQEYATSSLGVTILNENIDLSNNRKFINLYTGKASWKKVNQVIDTKFSELSTGTLPAGFVYTIEKSQDVLQQSHMITGRQIANV